VLPLGPTGWQSGQFLLGLRGGRLDALGASP
jgi:hypothetical protein